MTAILAEIKPNDVVIMISFTFVYRLNGKCIWRNLHQSKIIPLYVDSRKS